VYRAFSSAILSALMTLTLLWGGCISCDQFFMLSKAKTDCCKKDVCERPSKAPAKTEPEGCEKMPLDQPSRMHSESDATANSIFVPVVGIATLSHSMAPATLIHHPPAFQPVLGSPPDLRILNSSFVI